MDKGVSAATTRTVLVVDDEPLIRMNLTAFLEDEGCQVLEAENADAAIATLERHASIQIVVTDVQMPGSMDGVTLTHFIRDRWPPTVLIVSSGVARLTARDLPSQTAFLAKPLDLNHLVTEIDRLAAAG